MPYYRVTYDEYIEGVYNRVEDSKNAFLDILDDVLPDQLSVEVFDNELQKWIPA